MRKESREMPATWALEVFDHAPFATLGMVLNNNLPYSLPISHARTDEKTFYFHCANEGLKLDAIAENHNVCLSAVSKCRPCRGPKDGTFTLEYKSAIAFGVAEIVTDDSEKVLALRKICEKYLPKQMEGFEEAVEGSLSRTTVVRISLSTSPTGKRKQYDVHGDEMKYGRME